jgi:hypothetical protein
VAAVVEGNKSRHEYSQPIDSKQVPVNQKIDELAKPKNEQSLTQAAAKFGTNRQYVSDAKKLKDRAKLRNQCF